MFGAEDNRELEKPSQIIGFAYPGEYDYEFLKKADEVSLTKWSLRISEGKYTTLYSIGNKYNPALKYDKKQMADAIIEIVKKRMEEEEYRPF